MFFWDQDILPAQSQKGIHSFNTELKGLLSLILKLICCIINQDLCRQKSAFKSKGWDFHLIFNYNTAKILCAATVMQQNNHMIVNDVFTFLCQMIRPAIAMATVVCSFPVWQLKRRAGPSSSVKMSSKSFTTVTILLIVWIYNQTEKIIASVN